MSEGRKQRWRRDEPPAPTLVLAGFVEAERYAVACLLLYGQTAMQRYSERGLTAEAFATPAYQLIFQAAQVLFDAGQPISSFAITRSLKESGEFDRMNGTQLFSDLLQSREEITPSDAEGYAEALLDVAARRRTHAALAEASELIKRTDRDLASVNDQIAALVEASLVSGGDPAASPIAEIAPEVYADILRRNADPDAYRTISTGLSRLDHLLGGLGPGRLYVIAARPGKGKTALALSIAHHVAKVTDRSVLVFSMEMSRAEVTKRLAAIEGHVNARLLNEPARMQAHDIAQLKSVFDRIAELPIYVDETPNPPTTEIRARIRKFKRECPKTKPLEVVFVDYLQLMGSTTGGGGADVSRNQEISTITRSLKQIARTENVAVVLLSQLSRDIEKRAGATGTSSRPKLSDLRDSGSIESDADVVMFVHREDPGSEEAAVAALDQKTQDASVLVEKNRHGAPGPAHCAFMPPYMHFVDVISGEAGGPQTPNTLDSESEEQGFL